MNESWQVIPFCEYPDAVDLTGKDLFSLFSRSKDDVQTVVAPMRHKSEMQLEELPPEYRVTMTGEVVDEIHQWPNAILGTEFYDLTLKFRNDRLIGVTWKSRSLQPSTKKPWWKFW